MPGYIDARTEEITNIAVLIEREENVELIIQAASEIPSIPTDLEDAADWIGRKRFASDPAKATLFLTASQFSDLLELYEKTRASIPECISGLSLMYHGGPTSSAEIHEALTTLKEIRFAERLTDLMNPSMGYAQMHPEFQLKDRTCQGVTLSYSAKRRIEQHEKLVATINAHKRRIAHSWHNFVENLEAKEADQARLKIVAHGPVDWVDNFIKLWEAHIELHDDKNAINIYNQTLELQAEVTKIQAELLSNQKISNVSPIELFSNFKSWRFDHTLHLRADEIRPHFSASNDRKMREYLEDNFIKPVIQRGVKVNYKAYLKSYMARLFGSPDIHGVKWSEQRSNDTGRFWPHAVLVKYRPT